MMLDSHLRIELFDKELTTKFLYITVRTFGQDPAEEMSLSLVYWSNGRASYRHNFCKDLMKPAYVVRS